MFANGPSNWDYRGFFCGEDWEVEEYIDEIARNWDWSEHFRGVEYDEVDFSPKEWLEKEINACVNQREQLRWRQNELQRALDQHE